MNKQKTNDSIYQISDKEYLHAANKTDIKQVCFNEFKWALIVADNFKKGIGYCEDAPFHVCIEGLKMLDTEVQNVILVHDKNDDVQMFGYYNTDIVKSLEEGTEYTSIQPFNEFLGGYNINYIDTKYNDNIDDMPKLDVKAFDKAYDLSKCLCALTFINHEIIIDIMSKRTAYNFWIKQNPNNVGYGLNVVTVKNGKEEFTAKFYESFKSSKLLYKQAIMGLLKDKDFEPHNVLTVNRKWHITLIDAEKKFERDDRITSMNHSPEELGKVNTDNGRLYWV